MEDIDGRRAAPLAVGTVLGRAFGVMSGNPATVFGIALLFGALPQAVFGFLIGSMTAANTDARIGVTVLGIGILLIFLIGSMVSQAALVRTTSAYLDGRSIGIAESLRGAFAKVLPLIGLSILFGLGVALGFLLLTIPGIILFLMWSVAVPVLIEEDAGVTEAFGRSRALTKGARWRIFFLMIVTVVITWLLAAVGTIPALIVEGHVSSATPTVAGMILGIVTTTLTVGLWSTVLTSLYFTLRERREGPQTDKLAEVFA